MEQKDEERTGADESAIKRHVGSSGKMTEEEVIEYHLNNECSSHGEAIVDMIMNKSTMPPEERGKWKGIANTLNRDMWAILCAKAESEAEEKMESSAATSYRGMTARMNYLGQDRSEVQFAIKELSKDMSSPTVRSWGKLKRLLRYLKGKPRYRMTYGYQSHPPEITVWSDSEFARCKKSRKSTSAGVLMLEGRTLKSWSSNQAFLALSFGEAEYASFKAIKM